MGRLDARGRGLARGQAIARLVADDQFRRHIDELGADLQVDPVQDCCTANPLLQPTRIDARRRIRHHPVAFRSDKASATPASTIANAP